MDVRGARPPTQEEAEALFSQNPEPEKQRTWMDTAKDVAIGAGKGVAHTALDAASAVRMIPGVAPVTDAIGNALGGAAAQMLYGTKGEPVSGDKAMEQARTETAYTNLPQMVGGGLETAAELALPALKAAKAVPTTAKAGAKFQGVMSAAKNVPIDTNAPGQVALRIQELAERGGSMPMAVRKFLGRITDPNKAPMAYEEARDFASNISRLSANEYSRLPPAMAREVANLRVVLNQANAQAAKMAGKGAEYAQAMQEYRRAMQIRDAIEGAIEGAKRGLPYAGAAGAGYWLTSKLKGMLGAE